MVMKDEIIDFAELLRSEGVVKTSGYKRYSFRYNLDHKITNGGIMVFLPQPLM